MNNRIFTFSQILLMMCSLGAPFYVFCANNLALKNLNSLQASRFDVEAKSYIDIFDGNIETIKKDIASLESNGKVKASLSASSFYIRNGAFPSSREYKNLGFGEKYLFFLGGSRYGKRSKAYWEYITRVYPRLEEGKGKFLSEIEILKNKEIAEKKKIACIKDIFYKISDEVFLK